MAQDNQPGASEPVSHRLLTSDEVEAQRKAQIINAELAATREVLDADALHSLIAPRARLERAFEALHAYFFTIDGVLRGRKVQGALFAGECILVFANSERAAQEQANAGLRTTIELLDEEYRTRDLRLSPTEEGLSPEAAGRRALAAQVPLTARSLEQRDVLQRMMSDAFAKAAKTG